MKRSNILLLLSVALVTVACAGNLSPDRQMNDAVLAAEVREALRADPQLGLASISVDARGGIVTLRGSVSGTALRDRAAAIARGVAGVESVENLLTIR